MRETSVNSSSSGLADELLALYVSWISAKDLSKFLTTTKITNIAIFPFFLTCCNMEDPLDELAASLGVPEAGGGAGGQGGLPHPLLHPTAPPALTPHPRATGAGAAPHPGTLVAMLYSLYQHKRHLPASRPEDAGMRRRPGQRIILLFPIYFTMIRTKQTYSQNNNMFYQDSIFVGDCPIILQYFVLL